jgi:hypothetical protein
LALNPNYELEQ